MKYLERIWLQLRYGIGCGTPLYLAIVAIIIFLCCSCASRKNIEYVDREVVRYETKILHDTINVERHDSVFYSIVQKGDTVYNTKYIERIKYKDKIVERIDTFWRDSIRMEYKKLVVEKKIIPKWCYYCLGICVLFCIFATIKIVRFIQCRWV